MHNDDEPAPNWLRTSPGRSWTTPLGPSPLLLRDDDEPPPPAASLRFEPTVTAAVRRYRVMVVLLALLGTLVAVAWSLVEPRKYQARAEVTVPRQLSLPELEADQYLDSQVMLLQSQEVARNAVKLANAALGGNRLTVDDFFGERSRLEITPPVTATPGTYGASIITVSFTWTGSHVAKVAADSVLRAFDTARTKAIVAQGTVTVAGIDQAIDEATTSAQRANLLNQRSQVVVNQQIDLAHHPTTTWATEPATATNGRWLRNGGIGLLAGAMAGAALAFARATRHRHLTDPLEPAELYAAPLMGEIPYARRAVPAARRRLRWRRRSAGDPEPEAAAPEPAEADDGAPARGDGGSRTGDGPPLPGDRVDAAFTEAFRFTVGYLERARPGRGRRLAAAVVSPRRGAGRTTVVAGLALALAEGGTRVLAVDAADGTLTRALLPGVPAADGLRQVLAGRRLLGECVRTSPLTDFLTVLGPGVDDVPRLSGGARFRAVCDLLVEARARFEVVLLDGPPLLEASEAVVLAETADVVVVVVCPDDPRRDHLDLADRLRSLGVRPLGYVYDRAPRRPDGARPAALARPGAAAEG